MLLKTISLLLSIGALISHDDAPLDFLQITPSPASKSSLLPQNSALIDTLSPSLILKEEEEDTLGSCDAESETTYSHKLTFLSLMPHIGEEAAITHFFCSGEFFSFWASERFATPKPRLSFAMSSHFTEVPSFYIPEERTPAGGYFWILLPAAEEGLSPPSTPLSLSTTYTLTSTESFDCEDPAYEFKEFKLDPRPKKRSSHPHPTWNIDISSEKELSFENGPEVLSTYFMARYETTSTTEGDAIALFLPIDEPSDEAILDFESGDEAPLSYYYLAGFERLTHHTPVKKTLSWPEPLLEMTFEEEVEAAKICAISEMLGRKIGLAMNAQSPVEPATDLSHFEIEMASLSLPSKALKTKWLKTAFARVRAIESRYLEKALTAPLRDVVFEKSLRERFTAPSHEPSAFEATVKELFFSVEETLTSASSLSHEPAMAEPQMAVIDLSKERDFQLTPVFHTSVPHVELAFSYDEKKTLSKSEANTEELTHFEEIFASLETAGPSTSPEMLSHPIAIARPKAATLTITYQEKAKISSTLDASIFYEVHEFELPGLSPERSLTTGNYARYEKAPSHVTIVHRSLETSITNTPAENLQVSSAPTPNVQSYHLQVHRPSYAPTLMASDCSIYAIVSEIRATRLVDDLFAHGVFTPNEQRIATFEGDQGDLQLLTDIQFATNDPTLFGLESDPHFSLPLAAEHDKFRVDVFMLSPEGLATLETEDVIFEKAPTDSLFVATDEQTHVPTPTLAAISTSSMPEVKASFDPEEVSLNSALLGGQNPYVEKVQTMGPPTETIALLQNGTLENYALLDTIEPYRKSYITTIAASEELFRSNFQTVSLSDLQYSLGQVFISLPEQAYRDVMPLVVNPEPKATHETHYKLNRSNRECLTVYSEIPSLERLRTNSIDNPFKPSVQYTPRSKKGGYYFSVDLKFDQNHGLRREKQTTIFVLDRSSSVEKQRFEVFKRAVVKAMPYLKRGDFFNIVLYDNKAKKLSEVNLPVSENNLRKARRFLDDEQHATLFKSADIYAVLGKLSDEAAEDNHISHVVLLTEPKPFSNLRKKRRDVKKITRNNNRDFSLFIATACNREGLPMVELVSALNGGYSLFSPTNAAFPRKFAALVRQISEPVMRDISILAIRRDTGETLRLYPSSPKGESHFYALKNFTIHGEVGELENFELFIQGRIGKRWINLSQEVSFDKAVRVGRSLRRAIAKKESLSYYQSYLDDGEVVYLEKAAKLLNPHSVPLPHEWD